MDLTNQYNHIAEAYAAQAKERNDRRYVIRPTILHYMGPVTGKNILDLACGTGENAAMLAEQGATVTGIDVSPHMVARAIRHPSITYQVGNANSLEVEGFDIVLAAFLLHYAETPSEMSRMAEGIYRALKPGGRLVCLNNNPWHPTQDARTTYEYVTTGDVRPGGRLTVRNYAEGKEVCRFQHYYWPASQYEDALVAAGFDQYTIRWEKTIVSPEGLEKFPAGFWDDYCNPIVLTATR